MEHITKNLNLHFEPSIFRSEREELVARLTDGINLKRQGTKYPQVTTRQIAIRCNSNPFLKSDSELRLLIQTCEDKGSYSKFFFCCPLNKKR